MIETIPLTVVRRDNDKDTPIHLILNDGRPVELGNGRFALVWLAASGNRVDRADLLALKLVRHSADSQLATAVTRWRFFEEMLKTWDHGTANENNGMVRFVAYGAFGSGREWQKLEAKRDDVNHASEYQFFGRLGVTDQSSWERINTIRVENLAAIKEHKELSQTIEALQGEFYAMPAAHGTLEDVLLKTDIWSTNRIFSFPESPAATMWKILKEEKGADAAQFHSDEASPREPSARQERSDASGLSLLSQLKRRELRNRIVVSLARRLAESLSDLHQQQAKGEGYLAHRDLKLGNFLVSCTAGRFNFVLADLGFVGGKESVVAGRMTGQLNAKEAFALPPGTFPFRAPEQAQPVLEITCETGATCNEYLTVHAYTDVAVDKGDWIESSDLLFTSVGDAAAPQPRARIEEATRVSSREYHVKLSWYCIVRS